MDRVRRYKGVVVRPPPLELIARRPGSSKKEKPKAREADITAAVQKGLATIRLDLALVQTGYIMAMEGTTRATASQVVERVWTEFEVEVAPWRAGQVFSQMGVRTATAHGKTRLVLDPSQLGPWQEQIAALVDGTAQEVEKAIASFGDVAGRIQALDEQLQETQRLAAQEQEIRGYLGEHAGVRRELGLWQGRYQQVRGEVRRVEMLEKECTSLSQKLKTLPRLDRRKRKLLEALARRKEEEEGLAKQERALADEERTLESLLARLRDRNRLVRLGRLDEAIGEAEKELKSLSERLGEKRSLFDRLLGGRQEGGPA